MSDDPIFDAAAFEQLKTTVDGDASFLATLIADYLDDAADHLTTMRHAAADGNAALLERTAHSLKSTSETMGAMALAGVCRRIERPEQRHAGRAVPADPAGLRDSRR